MFIVVDHFTFDVWVDAVKKGNRFAALEPPREAVIERFGTLAGDVARGLKLRHDHGTQFVSDHYQEVIRQIKEQVLWARTFETVAEVRQAVREFAERFRNEWMMERLGYLTPREAYAAWKEKEAA